VPRHRRARIGLEHAASRPLADAPAGQRLRRGRGVALSAHISGLLASGAIVRLLEDGSVLLNTGAVDIGQGRTRC
jgi:CO/xanthine dehydrogenase Mo-binding subunit